MLLGVGISNCIYFSRHWLYQKFSFVRWLYKKDRWWVLYLPLMSIGFGLLSVVPSLLFYFELVPQSFLRSPVANLFFFHGYIESLSDTLPKNIDYLLSLFGEALASMLCMGIILLYLTIINRANTKIKRLEAQLHLKRK